MATYPRSLLPSLSIVLDPQAHHVVLCGCWPNINISSIHSDSSISRTGCQDKGDGGDAPLEELAELQIKACYWLQHFFPKSVRVSRRRLDSRSSSRTEHSTQCMCTSCEIQEIQEQRVEHGLDNETTLHTFFKESTNSHKLDWCAEFCEAALTDKCAVVRHVDPAVPAQQVHGGKLRTLCAECSICMRKGFGPLWKLAYDPY